MGLTFQLLTHNDVVVAGLSDPAGGKFDYCGGFDRLLPLPTELALDRGFALEILDRAEAFEDVDFAPHEMPALLRDISALARIAKPGPEQRGLDRLKVMAETCAKLPASRIRSLGD